MFTVYILQCADNTFYTGYSKNLSTRLEQHASGKGSKYVRSRRPFELVFLQHFADRSSAMKQEILIKTLPRIQKMRLIANVHLNEILTDKKRTV